MSIGNEASLASEYCNSKYYFTSSHNRDPWSDRLPQKINIIATVGYHSNKHGGLYIFFRPWMRNQLISVKGRKLNSVQSSARLRFVVPYEISICLSWSAQEVFEHAGNSLIAQIPIDPSRNKQY